MTVLVHLSLHRPVCGDGGIVRQTYLDVKLGLRRTVMNFRAADASIR